MRHYFENRSVQAHLYKTGQIDAAGRVIDMSKNASKFAIIEQEFKAAEKLEYWRKKEEAEMRHRVQMKRHEALARARRAEKMAKAKEDRRIRAEIVRCAKGITSGDMSASVSAPRSSFITRGSVLDWGGFLLVRGPPSPWARSTPLLRCHTRGVRGEVSPPARVRRHRRSHGGSDGSHRRASSTTRRPLARHDFRAC